jgi:AmiR/NasT family two-component response regulator
MKSTGRYHSSERRGGEYGMHPGEFEGIDVAVVTERDEQGTLLTRELQRLRAAIRHIWPAPDLLPADADVLICDYAQDLARRLPWSPGDPKAALIVIVPQAEPIRPESLANAAPDAVLARPFTANAVLASLVLARGQFRYEQRLRDKIERLDENLRAMRTVERAKSILVCNRKISDDEAYSFIRSQAMERRVSVSSVAAAIVSSYELLGPELK